MKGLDFTIFACGHIWNDKAWNIAMPYCATVKNKNPEHVFWRLPFVSILVRHPDEGNYLFDTGINLWDSTNRTDYQRQAFPFEVARDEYIDMQLNRVGMTLDDIDGILLSHMHWDHADGLEFFTGHKAIQNIYVNRKELADALIYSHGGPEYNEIDPMFSKRVLDLPDIRYNLVEEDTEIFEGVTLINLPGHTSGSMGMLLECEEHTYIFTGDAFYCPDNFGPPAVAPGIVRDTAAFYRSAEKLRRLQKEKRAIIIYGHDPDMEAVWQLAPRFYK